MRARWYLAGPFLAIVGGLAVWVGALLPWATTTADEDDLRRAMEVTPEGALAVADVIEASWTWVEGVDAAAWMLIFATTAIVLAAILTQRDQRLLAAAVAVLGAVVGVVAYVTRVDPAALALQIEVDADVVGGSGVWAGMPVRDSVVVDPGPGTVVLVVGAALIALGGLLAVVLPYRDPPADPSYVPWNRRPLQGPA